MWIRVSSSSAPTFLFQAPSALNRSSKPSVRFPPPCSVGAFWKSSVAPSVARAGAESLLAAATQRLPPSTTWQAEPSFFRQNPKLLRQKWLWLIHWQRVSSITFPPIVPIWRCCGPATLSTACARAGAMRRTSLLSAMSTNEVRGPIERPPSAVTSMPRSASMPSSATTMSASINSCFKFGIKSVPPARKRPVP